MKVSHHIGLLLTLFITSASFSQTPWTLERCVQYGLQNNSGFLSESMESQRSQFAIDKAKGSYLPSINGTAQHNFNQGHQWDDLSGTYAESNFTSGNVGVVAEVDIFKGFRNKYNLKIQKHQHNMQLSAIESARNSLALQIADAYMQILYSSEFVNAAKNQISITESELNKVQIHVEAGTKTKADLLRLRAQMETERSELVYQEGRAAIAKLNLMQLMEFTPDSANTVERFAINTDVPNTSLPILISTDSLYEAAKSLPEVAVAQYQLESAKEQIAFSKSMYSPELKAQAYYGTNYSSLAENSIGNQFGNNTNSQFGLHLSIPIFNKCQTKTAVAYSKIDYRQAEKAVIETEKALRFQIETEYQDAITSQRRYEVEQTSVAFYEESFRFAQAQLDAGTITALDFNTEKTALAVAQTKLIRARYELLYHTLMLNYFVSGQVKL